VVVVTTTSRSRARFQRRGASVKGLRSTAIPESRWLPP